MILDERLEFCDATALHTGATTAVLTGDVIDLGAVPQDLGNGRQMYLVIQVTTAVAGTSSTVQFELCSDAAAAMTVATASRHIVTEAIAEATLVAGYTKQWALPPNGGQEPYERYLGIIATVGAAGLSAGAINAFLTFDPSYWKSYADAVN